MIFNKNSVIGDETALYREIFHRFREACDLAIKSNSNEIKDFINDIFNITPCSDHLNYFIRSCLETFELDHLKRPLSLEEIKEGIDFVIKKWNLGLDFEEFVLITKKLWKKERFTLKEIYRTLSLIRTLGIEGLKREIEKDIFVAHPSVRDILLKGVWPKFIPFKRLIYWPRYPNLDLEYFDALLKCTAIELKNARKIAFEISKYTHAPIITLHNATMGAPSGWGIPSFKSQLKEGYNKWLKKVIDKWIEIRQLEEKNIKAIVDTWLNRMIKERILFKLYQLNANLELTEGDKKPYLEIISLCSRILSLEDFDILKRAKFAQLFIPNDILIEDIFALIKVYLSETCRVRELLSLLAAITSVSKGICVIPVIDKFIRSSYGGRDIAYAKMFFEFIKSFNDKVIFLLFDETIHPKGPTLKEAIKALDRTIGVRGLGVYGHGERDMIGEITKMYPRYSIFVLSNHHNNSVPKSFNRLVEDYDINYLDWRGYHPGWRDGLGILFEGTRVAFLTEKEIEDEVVLTDAGPIRLGVYFRKKLREYAGVHDIEDPFWTFYSILANLV